VTQKFQNFEVIIVDDFSDDFDKLLNVIEGYKKNLSITILRHEENKNGAAARNTGLLYAKEPFVAFLDCDDSWHENKLSVVNDLILSGVVDDLTLIYSMYNLYIGNQFKCREPNRCIQNHEPVADYIFCHNNKMQTSTFVCKRELALDVGFDERFTRHQDAAFVMLAQKKGYKFFFIAAPLVNYIFPLQGLLVRIKQKQISSAYCAYWLKEMRAYFSPQAINGYNFYMKSRVLIEEGRLLDACLLRFFSMMRFTPAMYLSLGKFLLRRFIL